MNFISEIFWGGKDKGLIAIPMNFPMFI